MAGYPLGVFLTLDLLGGFLWATAFALVGQALGPVWPLALSNRTIWILTALPFVLSLLARIAKRMVKGPAEEALVSKLPSRFSEAVSPDFEV